ncbi:MAG: hypothetical protein HKL80_04825 [Acidimicrobiales bacterium]|nr:hypothetical protein [Acidimicrobiales bacterium]
MSVHGSSSNSLNSLIGSLFLLSSFAMLATRQIQSYLRIFAIQTVCLASSAVISWIDYGGIDLLIFAGITLLSKAILLPIILKRLMPDKVFQKREINQSLPIPLALISGILLTLIASASMLRLVDVGLNAKEHIDLAFGMASFLIGLLTLVNRKETLPQLIALLALENSVQLVGIAIAPIPSVFVELGTTFDVMVLAVTVTLVAQIMYHEHDSTDISEIDVLTRETP